MNFFWRKPKKTVPTNSGRPNSLQEIFAPIPVADVAESTWNEWEDSVAFQNSQDDASEPSHNGGLDIPLELPNEPVADPFASVSKKGG